MILDNVSPGGKIPDEVNVVIEIPAQSNPVKYEMDKRIGALLVDRFMSVAMFYPCNYGFVPHTLAEDGDPPDVLVITPVPVMSGCVINSRPVGMLRMRDEAGPDAKILAVPVPELNTMYDDVRSPSDLPKELLHQISHFFEQYKVLEHDKWVEVDAWVGPEDARREILDSIARYDKG